MEDKKKEDIIYNFTRELPDKQKSRYGRYYTPKIIVERLTGTVLPYIKKESIIMDITAGCGAFLQDFRGYRVIARDMDIEAVEHLKSMGFKDVGVDNSLLNVSRSKYGLNKKENNSHRESETEKNCEYSKESEYKVNPLSEIDRQYNNKKGEHIVIVGNPPYNDWTSKNKKIGKNAKEKPELDMDADLRTRDLGISFLRAFCKLDADVICVLHPLSYLIKESNFNRIGEFTDKYYLKKGEIFSSREFSDTQQTPFPILIALYLKGKMNYEYIRNFDFDIYDSRCKMKIANIETIDGYIRKYPPKKGERRESDTGIYMYNIRDTNSLITTGNLSDKINFEYYITIDFKDFYKYAYLNCMKRYFDKDFLLGNLSPIVSKKDLEENEYIRDIFVIDTIINNQKLPPLNTKNKDSLIYKFGLMDEYKGKMNNFSDSPFFHFGTGLNPYRVFVDFVNLNRPDSLFCCSSPSPVHQEFPANEEGKKKKTIAEINEQNREDIEKMKNFIKNYFIELKRKTLSPQI